MFFPPSGWFWGDPHIITTDGLSYTFNGQGEYLFTKIGHNDTVIQARTERVKLDDGGQFITATTDIIVKENNQDFFQKSSNIL